MAKKQGKAKKKCTGKLDLHFPDYITPKGTCRNPNQKPPDDPDFEPLDVFWHRDSLSGCVATDVHTISGAIFRDEHGNTVITKDHHRHTPGWGTL